MLVFPGESLVNRPMFSHVKPSPLWQLSAGGSLRHRLAAARSRAGGWARTALNPSAGRERERDPLRALRGDLQPEDREALLAMMTTTTSHRWTTCQTAAIGHRPLCPWGQNRTAEPIRPISWMGLRLVHGPGHCPWFRCLAEHSKERRP